MKQNQINESWQSILRKWRQFVFERKETQEEKKRFNYTKKKKCERVVDERKCFKLQIGMPANEISM